MHVEVNGRAVDAGTAWSAATSFGHFTAMQVRNRATRGLDLHLRRLEGANRELFGVGLDPENVRELVRHALGRSDDASVRVYAIERQGDRHPAIAVTVREPSEMPSPQRLRSADYLRPAPHLKHLSTEQGYHARAARHAGFDDALLTAGLEAVSEAATANIGFLDGEGVVWPDEPMLHGVTMQLLETALPRRGVSVRRATIRLADLAAFDGAFLANARGIGVVSAIDDVVLPEAARPMAELAHAYAAVPWEAI
jgi:branched-subunit amino acid aminotransferase/4-amino-4-deoxychorismate lyase